MLGNCEENVIGDILFSVGAIAVMGIIYFGLMVTFGNSKYRRWAKQGRNNKS
jgi:type IV secretory pathway VirB2 component (pilin)